MARSVPTVSFLPRAVADFCLAVTVGECLSDEPQNWYREPVWTTPATRSKKGCVVSGNRFCGKLLPFHTKKQCFESNHHCEQDVYNCKNGPHTDKEACQKMEKMC